MRLLIAVAVILASLGGGADKPDLSRYFTGIDGTFVMLNGTTGEFVRHNDRRARVRFPPCSTFKIPNTAILLQTGAVPDPDSLVKYDPALNAPLEAWRKDHTLRSAFKESVVWYYQVLSRRAGLAAESRFVRQFQYGNEKTTGGLDKNWKPFWLDGSLRISANEQVAFLKRLHDGRLGLADRTTRLTEEVMLVEETPTYRLRAKTGACQPQGEDAALWYVGWVERAEGVYYFALEMGDKSYDRLFPVRASKAREILGAFGVLR